MAYKQQPKSPVLKALVGDQHKLPKVLKDAIEASPAKQTVRDTNFPPPKMTKEERQAVVGSMKGFYDNAPSTLEVLKPSASKFHVDSKPPEMTKSKTKKVIKKAKEGIKGVNSPAKQSTYKGGARKTDAQMADRTRRVEEGLTVRRNDYAPGKEGQASFNTDRKASFNNRRAKHASIRTRLQSGEITKQEAMRERNDYAKAIQKSASYKRTKADRDKGDAPTTYIVSRKGIKRKVSDAEKASYESVSTPAKQTKKTPKYTGKITGVEKRKGKPGYTVSTTGSVDPKDVMRAAKTGAMPSRKKTQQKVKKTGPKKTLDGNVIKY